MTGESVGRGFADVEHWTYEVESPFRPSADIAALATRTEADESESQLEEAQRADLQLEPQEAAGGTSAVAEDPAYEWEYRWMADLHELGNAVNSPYGEIELLDEVDRRSRVYSVWVQQSLNQVADAGLATDGKIGPLSQAAIRRFQAAHRLTADGIVGAETEAALVAAGATAPPGATRTPTPGGSGTAPTPATMITAAIPITVPATCVEVPALPGPDRACSGVDSTRFAGIAEVATFCGGLADCYADRMAVRRQRERHAKAQDEAARAATAARVPNETRTARAQRLAAARAAVQPEPVATVRTLIRGSYLQFLEEDFRDTILGASNRWGDRCHLRSVARMWMFGVRERLDFVTLGTDGRSLGMFAPPAQPAVGDQLVDIEPPGTTSGGAKVQPVMNTFLRALRSRAARHSAYNYPGHGGSSFNGRGYSIDLELGSPKDERGFYQRPAAVQFLLAIDAAARAAGVQWRAIYNDYAVAAAVNRHLDRKHVIFIGQIRRGRRLGLNWHGPLILHFHLDIAPQSQGPDREEESLGLALPEQAEEFLFAGWTGEDLAAPELEPVDPTAEFSPEALGDLEEPAESYPEAAGEYDLEDQWVAPAEQLDGSEALDPPSDEEQAFTPDDLDTALLADEDEDEDEQPEQPVEESAVAALETLVEAETGAGSTLADRVRGVATFVIGPTLRRGSQGPAVAALQRALGSLGYDVAIDGDFGPNTERAVRAVQGRLGLPVDGVVGPGTKSGIAAALSERGQAAAAPSPGGPAATGATSASPDASATDVSPALTGRMAARQPTQTPPPTAPPASASPGSRVLVGTFGQVPEGWIRVPVADMVRGIDVSHHQGIIDWALVAQSGVGFAYAKATEGRTHRDNRFGSNWADARSNGIPRGAYHLLREPSSSSVADQAQNFLNTVTLQSGDLPPAIDIEVDGKKGAPGPLRHMIAEMGVAHAWEHIWKWCEAIEAASGFRPLLYMSKRGIDLLKGNVGSLPALELWMPRYPKNRNVNDLPPLPQDTAGHLIFPHWSIWQYSEKGKVPGISGRGLPKRAKRPPDVDLCLFNGNQGHFSQWIQTVQP